MSAILGLFGSKDRSWFWVRQAEGRNHYVGMIRKMLAVGGKIPLETLRDGILRHHRTRGTSLPRHVFEGLCRAAGFRIADGMVSASEPIDPGKVLGGVETTLVDILRNYRGAMNAADRRDECLRLGLNRHSHSAYVSWSPLLGRVAPSVYALRGTAVDPAAVAYLSGRSKPSEPSLQDHGWTKDRAIWLAYKVT